MRLFFLPILLIFSFSILSQNQIGKTSIIKVRAGLAKCEIKCEDKFLLEKESTIQIKITGRNVKTDVRFAGCVVRSQKGDTYRLRFISPGVAAIYVYQITPKGNKLIAVKQADIVPPPFYFCGLKIDSSSKMLKLGPVHLYAYSDHYKAKLPVNKFYMLYYKDFSRSVAKGRKPIADTLRSDTCKLTKAMRERIRHFQPKSDKIYFYNLYFTLPDKTIRPLDPVELGAVMDTLLHDYSVIYLLRRKPI